MNVQTLKKMLDDYGFETEKVLDCLVDVFIKQNVDKGVLAQDVSKYTGVLYSYRLLEKRVWGTVTLVKCTERGERIARQLLKETIGPVFEQVSQIHLEVSYMVLLYLPHLVSQVKAPSRRPELKWLSSLPVIQEVASRIKVILCEHKLVRTTYLYSASGPTRKVMVTVPDLSSYFEPYYKEKVSSFEQQLQRVSKKLHMFRVLYLYNPDERLFLRKLKEHTITLQDISALLHEMKQKKLIWYSRDPLSFKIEDKKRYKQFLKECVLSEILDEFSHQITQPIQTNPQAYAVLAAFEEDFRAFLQKTLENAEKNWEERIPPDVVDRLKERQKDAEIRKKTVYPLLHYIDFPNYLSIILHRTNTFSNWDLFEPYFVSIGWIKGRLIEMNEIRNDLAHPKPLEPLQFRKLQLYIDEIKGRINTPADNARA